MIVDIDMRGEGGEIMVVVGIDKFVKVRYKLAWLCRVKVNLRRR